METWQTILAKYSLIEDQKTVGDKRMLLSESWSEMGNWIHIVNIFGLPLLIFMSGLAAVTMF